MSNVEKNIKQDWFSIPEMYTIVNNLDPTYFHSTYGQFLWQFSLEFLVAFFFIRGWFSAKKYGPYHPSDWKPKKNVFDVGKECLEFQSSWLK